MANAGLSWSVLRPLRPVLLAGAAAMAWMAFSAPAAEADNHHEQPSLLGGITSTVSSASNGVGKAVGNAASGAPAAHAPKRFAAAPHPASLPMTERITDAPGAISSVPVPTPVTAVAGTVWVPVVAEVTKPVDTAVGALPVADILPVDTVAAVTDPVVTVAETAVADIAENVAVPVTDTLPVDLPVEPITDLTAGTPALSTPVVTPITDVVVDGVQEVADRVPAVLPAHGNAPVARTGDTSVGGTSAGTAYFPAVSLVAATSASGAPSTNPAGSGSSGSGESPGSSPALPAGGGSPAGGRTHLPEALLPASPSGSGSGQSSGGPAASAAWLSSPFEYLPMTGNVPVSGPLQHIPSPVAIDPGSSPD